MDDDGPPPPPDSEPPPAHLNTTSEIVIVVIFAIVVLAVIGIFAWVRIRRRRRKRTNGHYGSRQNMHETNSGFSGDELVRGSITKPKLAAIHSRDKV